MNISWTILIIVVLTAISCAVPGMFLVLRGVALLSDAISHSVLLGIVVMFLLVRNLNSPLLFMGACIAGVLTVFGTEMLIATKRLKSDAAISLVFPLFFSIGVLLVSLYVRNVHLDIDMILLGEVALAPFNRLIVYGHDIGPIALWQLGLLLCVQALFVSVWYRPFIFSIFDTDGATVAQLRPQLFYYALITITSITSVIAFDIVGSVVVVALMITPAAGAFLCARSLPQYIAYTLALALIGAVSGYGLASVANVSVAGSVCVCVTALFVGMLVFAYAPKR